MSRPRLTQQKSTFAAGYGGVAKTLHWFVLVLLAAQFAVAWIMPEIERDTEPTGLVGLHLSLGAIILAVAVLRLSWRLVNPVPLVSENLPRWQYRAARATHALLYLLILVLPLLGWANASYRGWSIDLFGIATLPPILAKGSPLGHACGDLHVLTSYALLAVVGLHLAAALYHHFWLRDRVLSRMLPGGGG